MHVQSCPKSNLATRSKPRHAMARPLPTVTARSKHLNLQRFNQRPFLGMERLILRYQQAQPCLRSGCCPVSAGPQLHCYQAAVAEAPRATRVRRHPHRAAAARLRQTVANRKGGHGSAAGLNGGTSTHPTHCIKSGSPARYLEHGASPRPQVPGGCSCYQDSRSMAPGPGLRCLGRSMLLTTLL